jgi:hypothetical protein
MRGFGVSQSMGRRSVPRTQATSLAVLSLAAGDFPAALVDISRTGARLRAEMLPHVSQHVIFSAGKVRAAGEVVWFEPGTCAIEFDTPIAIAEVQRLRRLGLRDGSG